MKKYELWGEESGFIESFDTLKELKEFLKDLKRFDRENGIQDTYYIEVGE